MPKNNPKLASMKPYMEEFTKRVGEEIFNDPVLSAAMVDRLTYKAYMVNMNGNSYRVRETEEFIKSLK